MTNTTNEATTEATPALAKTVADLVPERRTFPTLEAAGVALAAIAAEARDFADVPLLAPGATFSDEGEFIPTAPEWTSETHEIMLTTLGTKAQKDKDGNTVKEAVTLGLVFCPIPTVAAVQEDATGLATLLDVWRKEMNHRAVRKLRGAENMTAAVAEMPLTLDSFVTSQSGGGTSGLAPFEKYFKDYSKALAKKVDAYNKRFKDGNGKAAIRAAMENAAKASALYPELESAGLFARLLAAIISRATAEGMDCTLLQTWLDTREAQTYTVEAVEISDDDDLFADMLDESEGDAQAEIDTPTGEVDF
jgi:hypothetical protein